MKFRPTKATRLVVNLDRSQVPDVPDRSQEYQMVVIPECVEEDYSFSRFTPSEREGDSVPTYERSLPP